MRRTLLKSKIHRATVTDADLHYIGSMTLDPELMVAADLLVHERVDILNITNGERFSTYVIEGKPGQGEVVLNGAAAHKASAGDLVIICSYAEVKNKKAAEHKPTVIFVDQDNRIVERSDQVIAHRQPMPMPKAM